MRRLYGCLTILAVCTVVAVGQDQPPAGGPAAAIDQKIIADAKANSQILANLTYLSDVIGPRLTGSPNLKRANEWAAEKMKEYGLTNVRLEPWTIPEGWERGTATARLLEPDNGRTITLAAQGWTPGTNGKIVGDVVVIEAKNSKELQAYKGKLKNAIILRGAPSRIAPLSEMSLFPGDGKGDGKGGGRPGAFGPPGGGQPGERGNFMEMMAFRREMSEFIRAEGAAVYLQDSGKPHGLLNMSGSWGGAGGAAGGGRDRASATNRMATAFVVHEHYALLHRLATRKPPIKTRMEIEITSKFVPGPIAVYNTVGEIKGSEKPDEFVVVGAHIDSWDLGQGTTDNGTGTSVVLEAARLIVKCGFKPKRTIRFVLFSGEEQGLHGSREFVKLHKDDMPKTTAALVHDTGTGKVVGLGWRSREGLKELLETELVALKGLGVTEMLGRQMGGSDHMSFEGAGVPSCMFRQDPAEYRFTHHSQSDTLDKAREPDLIQGAQVMAVAAMRFANLDKMLPRTLDKKEAEKKGRGEAKDGKKEE